MGQAGEGAYAFAVTSTIFKNREVGRVDTSEYQSGRLLPACAAAALVEDDFVDARFRNN